MEKFFFGKRIDKILVEDKKVIGIGIDNKGQFEKANVIVLGIPMRDISKLSIKDKNQRNYSLVFITVIAKLIFF
jgi:hypothetical protein